MRYKTFLIIGIIIFGVLTIISFIGWIYESWNFYNKHIKESDKKGIIIDIQEGYRNE